MMRACALVNGMSSCIGTGVIDNKRSVAWIDSKNSGEKITPRGGLWDFMQGVHYGWSALRGNDGAAVDARVCGSGFVGKELLAVASMEGCACSTAWAATTQDRAPPMVSSLRYGVGLRSAVSGICRSREPAPTGGPYAAERFQACRAHDFLDRCWDEVSPDDRIGFSGACRLIILDPDFPTGGN
jgi:hypothetical protein